MNQTDLQMDNDFPNLLEWMDFCFTSYAEKPFLDDLDQGVELSYADVAENVSRVCDRLVEQGLGKDDKLATNLENGTELATLILASLHLGSRLALIEAQTPLVGVQECLDLAEARSIVTSDGPCLADAETSTISIATWRDSEGRDGQGAVSLFEAAPANADDEAFVIFSSGTTGKPKGVVHTHGNIIHELKGMLDAYRFEADMRHLCVLPLAHVSGLYRSLLMPFCSGGKVLLRQRFDPQTFWRDVVEQAVNFVQLVPSHVAMLNRSEAGPIPGGLEDLKFVGTASAYLSPAEQTRFEARFGVPILQGYGLTEATCGITLNSLDRSVRRPGVVGLPLPVNEIRIVDSSDLEVDYDEVGEVCVRGENVTRKWLGDTRPEIIDGWLRTGDIGRFGVDGNLTLVGRKTQVVNRGAFKIYPLEVEEALLTLSGVHDAAVIGVPNPVLGEDLIGFVAATSDQSPESLIAKLRSKISSYKIPTVIIPVEKIPRNNMGKTRRDALLEIFEVASTRERRLDRAFLISEIGSIVSSFLDIDPVSVGPEFSRNDSPNWDSLEHLKILIAIEQRFGSPSPDTIGAAAARTIADLADLVRE